MLNTSQLTRVALKILGKYKGKLGEIAIWESEQTGDRLYREGELFQSQSSASGESRLPYVKMMEAFLSDANSVLLLGCGGGNLATMLARQGKSVTVVDHNPVSFDLAKRFFGLAEGSSLRVLDHLRVDRERMKRRQDCQHGGFGTDPLGQGDAVLDSFPGQLRTVRWSQ